MVQGGWIKLKAANRLHPHFSSKSSNQGWALGVRELGFSGLGVAFLNERFCIR